MPDPTLQPLLDTTYTKENFHRKVMLLKEFFSKRFFQGHADQSLKDQLSSFLSENNVGEALRSSLLGLPDTFFQYFSNENFSDTLKGLQDEVETMPHLMLYVATVLPPSEVARLGAWVRENIKPGLFIDLKTQADVVGGCAFVWNGVYHDYSLKYYFDKHRGEIRSTIRSADNGTK